MTAQKMKFSVKDLFSKIRKNFQFSADVFTFAKDNLNENLHSL